VVQTSPRSAEGENPFRALKIGEFEPEYIGKMQFYLSVLDDTVRLPEEQPSIGIILCKSKDRLIVEYALKDATLPTGVSTIRCDTRCAKQVAGSVAQRRSDCIVVGWHRLILH
jgi:hypothetical protein